MVTSERGSGRTTKQMQEAPEGAVYVYAGPRDYTKRLCEHLGRGDLVLCPPDMHVLHRSTCGTDRAVEIDHAIGWEVPLPITLQVALFDIRDQQNARRAEKAVRA